MELGFGGGSMTEIEWEWIKEKCLSLNFKNIIEIGSGFSTTCFMQIMDHVDSYETNDSFINELNKRIDQNKVSIIKYKYPVFPTNIKKYDAALVDGPGQFNNNGRMDSMKYVEPLTDYVFIHDFSRKNEAIAIKEVFVQDKWERLETKRSAALFKRIEIKQVTGHSQSSIK
jgi:hypothetical protein